jgi:hypothetical protein
MCATRLTAIREYDAKLLLAYWLERAPAFDKNAVVKTDFVYPPARVAQVSWDPETGAITPDSQLPSWVFNTKLVAKPDQLIKRRGKAGLLALNKGWDEAKQWIAQRAGKPQKVSDPISPSIASIRVAHIPISSLGRDCHRHPQQLHRRALPPSPVQHRILRLRHLRA